MCSMYFYFGVYCCLVFVYACAIYLGRSAHVFWCCADVRRTANRIIVVLMSLAIRACCKRVVAITTCLLA